MTVAITAAPSGTPVWVRDLAAVTAYAFFAFYLTAQLWIDPANRIIASNHEDYNLFEWYMAHPAHILTHGGSLLFSHTMNMPDGVNLMANTSMLAITVPLTPVTLVFGAHTSLILAFSASYLLTAVTWYWLFSRHLLRASEDKTGGAASRSGYRLATLSSSSLPSSKDSSSALPASARTRLAPTALSSDAPHRGAAFIAAAFCGFSPAMVAHGCGQPNLVAQFMIPLLIWATTRLREPGTTAIIRNGALLGLFVVVQFFINEEILFLTAMALTVFCASYALMRPREVREYIGTFLAGLGVALLTALPLLAYPLWFQFYGPQTYRGLPAHMGMYTVPLKSYVTWPRQSILGNAASSDPLSMSPCEEHTFYGWPLVIALLVAIVWMWQMVIARALTITATVFILFSLGTTLTFWGVSIAGPWRLFHQSPLFESITPSRFGLLTTVVVGVLLGLGLDKGLKVTAGRKTLRWIPYAVAIAVLLPLAPKPLPTTNKPVPEFITSGLWREYVSAGKTMVAVPLPSRNQDALRWAARADLDYDLASGYFLGPSGPDDEQGRLGPPQRPMARIFEEVAHDGRQIEVNDELRAQVIEDLKYWRASVVVLSADHFRQRRLREVTTDLLGIPPQRIDGMWVWDVRPLVE